MKVVHNQGKQALKRLRRRLGLHVSREPIPDNVIVRIVGGYLSAKQLNANPRQYDNVIFIEVMTD